VFISLTDSVLRFAWVHRRRRIFHNVTDENRLVPMCTFNPKGSILSLALFNIDSEQVITGSIQTLVTGFIGIQIGGCWYCDMLMLPHRLRKPRTIWKKVFKPSKIKTDRLLVNVKKTDDDTGQW